MNAKQLPWRDYSGRVSPLKTAVFGALFVPAAWVMASYPLGLLGPRPLNQAIHQIGLWTIRLLFIALAVTPLRQTLRWSRLVLVRRMIGVAAFAYAALHLSLYVGDQAFDLVKVASEIARRIYLTIGFGALLGLAALAATSTDRMIRRLGGRRWQRLHRLAYPIGILALVHHFMQSKLNVSEPMVMSGLFLWLMGYRIIAWRRRDNRVPVWGIGLLGLAAGALTALGEAVWFGIATGAPVGLVLLANLDTATGIRPAWVVWGVAAAFFLAALARDLAPRFLGLRDPALRPTVRRSA